MTSLRLDNTNLYFMFAGVEVVIGTILFMLLSPGFLFALPPASKSTNVRTRVLVHTLLFLAAFAVASALVAFAYKKLHQRADENERRSKARRGDTSQVGVGSSGGCQIDGFVPFPPYADNDFGMHTGLAHT